MNNFYVFRTLRKVFIKFLLRRFISTLSSGSDKWYVLLSNDNIFKVFKKEYEIKIGYTKLSDVVQASGSGGTCK